MSVPNHLPLDLGEAILPFLPPKSLGRFKSVSKRWYSLISSPNYIKTYIRNYTKNNPNPNPTQLLLVTELGDHFYSLDIKQINTETTPATVTVKCLSLEEPWVRILGSCNGLVLALDWDENLCLLNPTTRKLLKVSGNKGLLDTFGFGYDSSTDDYKVISIAYRRPFVRVYSLRNKSWKTLPNIPYQRFDHYSLHIGVLLNNHLHLLVRNVHSTIIAAFSLADEKFHEIEFSNSINHAGVKFSHLCVLDGKLVIVKCEEFCTPELWVMEEYGVPKSSTKRCIFENSDMGRDYELFAQVSNRDILLGNRDEKKIMIYNMDERRCTSVTIEGCQEDFEVHGTYVESLESFERFC